jgi:hypothetical protein
MAANSLHHPTTTPKGEATVASDTAPRNDVKTRQTLIRTIDMVRTMADCEPDMLGDLVMFLSAVLMTRRNPCGLRARHARSCRPAPGLWTWYASGPTPTCARYPSNGHPGRWPSAPLLGVILLM